jgi:hypothetical protein
MDNILPLPTVLVTDAPEPKFSSGFLATLDGLPRKLFPYVAFLSKDTFVRIIRWTIIVGMAVLVGVLLKRTGLNKPLLTMVGLLDRQDIADAGHAERSHAKAKFLVRESARLVKSAIDKRVASPFEAYEDAAQALVLARAAKDVDDDVAKLSRNLGVDFFEYLTYAGSVAQDLRAGLAA